MKKTHFHTSEIEWKTFAEREWGPLRWKDLLNHERGGSTEFIFGLAELPPGGRLPLHIHKQAETDYILSGHGRVSLGSRNVELGPSAATYFPGDAAHAIEALGPEPLCYIYTYACDKLGQKIDSQRVEEKKVAQSEVRNWNNADSRWAMQAEIGELIWIEASKGYHVRARRLFDQRHGNAAEMKLGIAEIDPGIHYTLHYHLQPEIYYILSGKGIIYAGESEIEATPDVALYIGGRVVHGADSLGEEPLSIYYLYGTETVGQEDTWTPVEDIYTRVRRGR
jgi:mannose-6-phosphate isomerase-like protein (cupin superfamily)